MASTCTKLMHGICICLYTFVLYVNVLFFFYVTKYCYFHLFHIYPKQFAEVSPHLPRACDPITKVNTRHILCINNFLQITDRYDNHKYILVKPCLSIGMSWLFF